MKEITRIHLARTPFNIEIEAKKVLEKYLLEVQRALGADEDAMREIEARVIEIFAERGVSGERTITSADVEATEARLGAPSDFMDKSEPEAVDVSTSDKRLMRDGERGMLGGVCAGIADYFGINVMWPRLTAVLLTFISFGTAIVIYIVLWLVVPPAKTAAEKLQMRGEPVTLAALKEEAGTLIETPERSKPFVVVLRVLLGLGFAFTAFATIGLILLVIFMRDPLFGRVTHDLVTTHTFGSIGAAYIAAIIAGLLFASLMALASYASFAWTINRKLLIAGGIVIALGLASATAMVALGIRGSSQLRSDIEASKTIEIAPAELSSITQAVTFDIPSSVPIEYHVKTGTPSVEVHYLRGFDKPKVVVTQNSDRATISLKTQGDCPLPLGLCKVVIYGPALNSMTVTSGSVTYFPTTQNQLSVGVEKEGDLSISGGSVSSMSGTVTGSFDSSSSSVSMISFAADAGSVLTFNSLNTLTLTTPKLCNTSKVSVSYQSANSFTINDVPMTSSKDSTVCAQIDN